MRQKEKRGFYVNVKACWLPFFRDGYNELNHKEKIQEFIEYYQERKKEL